MSLRRVAFLCMMSGLSVNINAAGSLIGLGDLVGGTLNSSANAVGNISAVGYGTTDSGIEATRWTKSNGMQGIGSLSNGSAFSVAVNTNPNGSSIVGYSSSDNGIEAFKWTQSTGMVGLGYLSNGGFSSAASGVSSDGSIIVGESISNKNTGTTEAFRWTESNGMLGLGFLPGRNYGSSASDISANGSVIVGGSRSATSSEAFRWTASEGMVGLGDLPSGSFDSKATDVNYDGSVIVGYATTTSGRQAFRWTKSEGMIGLGGFSNPSNGIYHVGVSNDGSLISIVTSSNYTNGLVSYIWSQNSGLVNVKQWLINNDVDVSSFQELLTAKIDTYGDTIMIAGQGINQFGEYEAYIAEVTSVPEPENLGMLLAGLGLLSLIQRRRKLS